MRKTLLATTMLLPAVAFAQTDSGGGAAAAKAQAAIEAHAMQVFSDMLCNQNPYTEQTNSITGEKTGPMVVEGNPPAEVLFNHLQPPPEYTVGGRTFIVRKVVALPYSFETFRNGESIGRRQEHIIILYAGNDGPG